MRPRRIQQDEFPYHITTRTNERKFKLRKNTYKIFIAVLLETAQKFNVWIHHFKLMDNHYHMILSTPEANISTIMQFFNNQLAKRINILQRTSGHLWGQRFFSTIIENEVYAGKCTAYLYQNGVRIGLCERASEDPRLSSFEFYAKGKKISFEVIQDQFYLTLGGTDLQRQKVFCELVDQPLASHEIKAIQNGLRKVFYGSADFIRSMKQEYALHFKCPKKA